MPNLIKIGYTTRDDLNTRIKELYTTGVPLPFISYGGSSLIANLLGVAFVINVLRRDPEVRKSISERKEARSAGK